MRGIMPSGTRQLLLPASPLFIWLSLFIAFVLNVTLSVWFWGRASWLPDLLLVTLLFWNIQQTQRIGMGAAFFFGLIMDVQTVSLLGQHALSYTLLSFIAIVIHRRILWFKTTTQALQLIPLFAISHLVQGILRYFFSNATTDWFALIAPLLEAALWPIISLSLLFPQRRSPDPDATRPL
jgi:rod shape-determining protein MreD